MGARHSTNDAGMGRNPRDVLAPEVDAAAIGPKITHQDAECGGLAGTVRADQAHGLPGLDAQVQAIDRHQTAKALGRAAQLQERVHEISSCQRRGARRCHVLLMIRCSPRGSST